VVIFNIFISDWELNFKESSDAAMFFMLSKTELDFLLPTKLGVVKFTGEENKLKIK